MISLFTGTPGSGKSLDVARMIYIKLKLGHTVIGNMYVKPEKIAKCKGKYIFVDTYHLQPSEFVEYAKRYHKHGKEGQSYIVIDECQQIFNSRDWNAKDRKAWNEFFQLHRHFGYNVWLITQYDRLIDRQLRALVEYQYIHRKLSNIGFKGKLMSMVAGGNLFIKVAEWYPLHENVGHEFFKYSKKYGEFYDSYSAFGGEDSFCPNELELLLSSDGGQGAGVPLDPADLSSNDQVELGDSETLTVGEPMTG